MVRSKGRVKFSKKGIFLIAILILGAAFFVVGGTPFETFSLGEGANASIYFTSASFHDGILYTRGADDLPASLTMAGAESLTMITEPYASDLEDVAITRLDTGYSALQFSMHNPSSINIDGEEVTYGADVIASQREVSSWKVNTYKIRFEVWVYTLAADNVYCSEVDDQGLVDYTFENGMTVEELNHWYRTQIMNSVDLVFNIDLEGDTGTKHMGIVDVAAVPDSAEQQMRMFTYITGGASSEHTIPYDDYSSLAGEPTDDPKLPESGATVSKKILDTTEARTTSMEVTVNWASVAPGVTWHEKVSDTTGNVFSVYDPLSKIQIELEVDIYANSYDDAKFSIQDITFGRAPEFTSSFDWLVQNSYVVVTVIVIVLAIIVITLHYLGKPLERWMGEGRLKVDVFG